jgi:hypothetical protein
VLNLMRCQQLLARGDVEEAGRSVQQLSPKLQELMHSAITRTESPALYVTYCLLGRICRYFKWEAIDRKMAAVWEATSCHTKSVTLAQMIDVHIRHQLKEERHCAHRLSWQARHSAFTYASIEPPQLPIDWLYYPSLLFNMTIKVLILPWGIYSLYRYVKERDQCSREAGVASIQEPAGNFPPVHLLSQISATIKDENKRLEFFGLLDGGQHPSSALFAKSYLVGAFRKALKQYAYCDQVDTAVFAALRASCLSVDSDDQGKERGVIAVAVVIGEHLWVCVNGSTRVAINDKGKPLPLCVETSTQSLAAAPRITKIPLSHIKGRELIIGSRALWNVCRLDQAVEFVESNKGGMSAQQLAQALVAEAHHAGCKESLSALVVKF